MTGKIIKGGVPEDTLTGEGSINLSALAGERMVLKSDVVQALSSAEKIVADARQKAAEIIQAAREEESRLKEKGFQEGYEEGLLKLNETILEFKRKYQAMLRDAEKDLLGLSLKIAGRIVGKAIALDHFVLMDIIHRALESLKYQKEIRLRVSPEDVAFLKDNRLHLCSLLGESKEIEIVEDPLVTPGGCIIDTEIGTVDARLETQFRVIEKALSKS